MRQGALRGGCLLCGHFKAVYKKVYAYIKGGGDLESLVCGGNRAVCFKVAIYRVDLYARQSGKPPCCDVLAEHGFLEVLVKAHVGSLIKFY